MNGGIKTTANSTYKKLAVQWLNEVLCRFGGLIRIKFCSGRLFSAPKSPTSYSCKTLAVSLNNYTNIVK